MSGSTTGAAAAVVSNAAGLARLRELEAFIQDAILRYRAAGEKLREIHDQELYLLTHTSWGAYVDDKFGWARSHAHRLMDAAAFAEEVESVGLPAPGSERAARPYLGLPPGQRVDSYREAVEQAGGVAPPARIGEAIAAERRREFVEEGPEPRAHRPAPTDMPTQAIAANVMPVQLSFAADTFRAGFDERPPIDVAAVRTGGREDDDAGELEDVDDDLADEDLDDVDQVDEEAQARRRAVSRRVWRGRERRERNRTPKVTSKSIHYWTPTPYTDAARVVMGGRIELDPASCREANDREGGVGAARIFTPAEDGLQQEWITPALWLNPPYGTDEEGKSNAGRWCAKAIEEFKKGNVYQGIICVNALTYAPWFQQLYDFPICFTDHRIHFDTPPSEPQPSSPLNGTAFVYLGPDVDRFIGFFGMFGRVVRAFENFTAGGGDAPLPTPLARPARRGPKKPEQAA